MNTIEDIFTEFHEIKEEKTISLDQIKQKLEAFSDGIVLYGAGSAGIAFLNYLRDVGINPVFFSDGDPKRWGNKLEGLEIISYSSIVDRVGRDALVIVTINTDGVKYCKSFDEALREGGHQGVHKRLRDAGCKNVIDYTFFRRCKALFRGDKYNLPSCSDIYEMEEHEDDICAVYELLADEKSRDVYKKLVRFRMIDDTIVIPSEPQNRQYFEYELFPKKNNEVFVDCGAYNGISLKTFLLENDNQIGRYYGIEPDMSNFGKLSEYVSSLPTELRKKINIINKCAYDSEINLKLYALSGPGSFVADIGTQNTEGIRIDSLFKNNAYIDPIARDKVSLIKMNIEGSEIQALKGAENVIKECKPRLAISGYHKTHDLWEVPLLIHGLCSNYKLHLRSYMNNISFVFYAHYS